MNSPEKHREIKKQFPYSVPFVNSLFEQLTKDETKQKLQGMEESRDSLISIENLEEIVLELQKLLNADDLLNDFIVNGIQWSDTESAQSLLVSLLKILEPATLKLKEEMELRSGEC